jgi:hypothetical protein
MVAQSFNKLAVCVAKSGCFELVKTVRESCCGCLIGQNDIVDCHDWV